MIMNMNKDMNMNNNMNKDTNKDTNMNNNMNKDMNKTMNTREIDNIDAVGLSRKGSIKPLPSVLIALLTVVLTLFFLTGCVSVNFGGSGSIRGEGDMEEYIIDVGEYNKLRVEGVFEIDYYSAPSDKITLEIQPNLKEYCNIEVVNDELVVGTSLNISITPNKIPKLTVSTPELNRIVISGAAKITTFQAIETESLDIETQGAGEGKIEANVSNLSVTTSGAGSYSLSGSADIASFTMSGAGELDAFNMETRETTIILAGVGAIKVNCSERLRVNASGTGAVEYKGSPTVDLVKGGLVDVKKVD